MFPGNTEVACDGYDQDCDGADLIADGDNDGVLCDTDCNDSNAAMFPGNTEVPGDGIDNDCDGQVDESASGCDATETEPNNGWMAAESMALNTVMCGVVSTVGDADTFALTIPEWTQVAIDVDASILGSDLDSELYLFDGGGNMILSNDDDGISLDSFISTLVVDAGTYYASVGDFNTTFSSTHSYELSVSTSSPCDVIEIEPNGTWTFADPVLVGEMACGIVSNDLDSDLFEIYVLAGDTVVFDVQALDVGSSLPSQLVLYDSDGVTELARDEPSTIFNFVDPELAYTFSADGLYYIEVASDFYSPLASSGPYLLNID